MANNRVCGICKKSYKYCPSCAADAHRPTWMAVFCSENCREIYNVLDDCRYRSLSKKEAFDRLSVVDLSCTDKLPGYFKETLEEILTVEKDEVVETVVDAPVIVERTIETEQYLEETVIEDSVINESTMNEPVIEEIRKPKSKKKARYVE